MAVSYFQGEKSGIGFIGGIWANPLLDVAFAISAFNFREYKFFKLLRSIASDL